MAQIAQARLTKWKSMQLLSVHNEWASRTGKKWVSTILEVVSPPKILESVQLVSFGTWTICWNTLMSPMGYDTCTSKTDIIGWMQGVDLTPDFGRDRVVCKSWHPQRQDIQQPFIRCQPPSLFMPLFVPIFDRAIECVDAFKYHMPHSL